LKNHLVFLVSLFFVSTIYSQSFSPPKFLSSTPFELKGAVLIDVDGDGDLDVLAGGVGFNDSGIEIL
jgi:hypothetical protein